MRTARAERLGGIPFGRALVVPQIALPMLLLIAGGLLVRSMRQLLHSDIRVDRDHVVPVRVANIGMRIGVPRGLRQRGGLERSSVALA